MFSILALNFFFYAILLCAVNFYLCFLLFSFWTLEHSQNNGEWEIWPFTIKFFHGSLRGKKTSAKRWRFGLFKIRGFTVQCVLTVASDLFSFEMVEFVSGTSRESCADVERTVSEPKSPIKRYFSAVAGNKSSWGRIEGSSRVISLTSLGLNGKGDRSALFLRCGIFLWACPISEMLL